MFNALDLACYVSNEYFKKYHRKISNIKLQKTLYFLFAYWGGFIEKSKKNGASVEQDMSNYQTDLFTNEIEAWTYGPVIPDVFHQFDEYCGKQDIQNIEKEISEKHSGFVKSFIDDMLKELFPLSDFKLVDTSHEDVSWKSNYDENEMYHNNKIDKSVIIQEYANN